LKRGFIKERLVEIALNSYTSKTKNRRRKISELKTMRTYKYTKKAWINLEGF